jgi:hypothetical protein
MLNAENWQTKSDPNHEVTNIRAADIHLATCTQHCAANREKEISTELALTIRKIDILQGKRCRGLDLANKQASIAARGHPCVFCHFLLKWQSNAPNPRPWQRPFAGHNWRTS